MTSEERAQETFRSLATEAVNTIMDALDMLGDFAPLHKNEMYGPEVDECFNAIAEYLEKTRAKYEPEKRTRFVFASERSKRADLGVDREIPLKPKKRTEGRITAEKSNYTKTAGLSGCLTRHRRSQTLSDAQYRTSANPQRQEVPYRANTQLREQGEM